MPPPSHPPRDIVDSFNTQEGGAVTVERSGPGEVYVTSHDGADMTGMRLTVQEVGRLTSALLKAAAASVPPPPPRHRLLTIVPTEAPQGSILEEVPRNDD